MAFIASALLGDLGTRTVSVFVVDPITLTPLEPLIDLIPGVSPLRVTLDLIESEDIEFSYSTTENAVQDFSDITSNIHRNLQSMTVSGRLASFLQLGAPVPVPGSAPTPSSQRLDFRRVANLQSIADQKQIVAVVTPRFSLPSAIITNISRPWSPQLGESTTVTISFREARIANPLTGVLLPDYKGLTPGNNVQDGGGQSPTEPVNATAGPSPAPIGAPVINPTPT